MKKDCEIPPERTLPSDCVLISLQGNTDALLLSREQAVFCKIPAQEIEAVRLAISLNASLDIISESLMTDLNRHGFFDPPRKTRVGLGAVRLQITNKCDQKCVYCCTDSGEPRPNELTETEWFDVVDQAIGTLAAPPRFDILGGEPLLMPFALRLAAYILSNNCGLTLYSNGTQLSDPDIAKAVAKLIREGMELRISFAGPDATASDKLSGNPRFEASLNGVAHLKDFEAKFRTVLMLFPETVDAVVTHLPSFRKRLAPHTPLTFGIPFCGGRETGAHMFSSATELEAALDRISLEAGQRIPATPSASRVNRREACHCEFGQDLHIRSDGLVYKCFKMTRPIGNLREDKLPDIWARAKRGCRPAKTLSLCANCPLSSLCGAGCRSENALYTGSDDLPFCGPWRVKILAEMLALDRVEALEWPTLYLVNEAKALGIDTPINPFPSFTAKYRTTLNREDRNAKTH